MQENPRGGCKVCGPSRATCQLHKVAEEVHVRLLGAHLGIIRGYFRADLIQGLALLECRRPFTGLAHIPSLGGLGEAPGISRTIVAQGRAKTSMRLHDQRVWASGTGRAMSCDCFFQAS